MEMYPATDIDRLKTMYKSPIVLGERCPTCVLETPKDLTAQYETIFRIGKQLLGESDLDRLLNMAMAHAVEISAADRGLMLFFDAKGDIIAATHNLEYENFADPQFEISQVIIDKVKTAQTRVCLHVKPNESTPWEDFDAAWQHIPHITCLPLQHQGNTFGVIYLDNGWGGDGFKPETCWFLCALTDFIALAAYQALENKRLHQHVEALELELREQYSFEAIVGHHPVIIETLKLVAQVADSDATVLIQGESGTGKELMARALHFNSSRKSKPFIPLNCGAIAESLLESEFFGHVRGAFTGATSDKDGWFEHAHGGTIFLDEVHEMTPALQVKLLRVLQTGEYARVGSTAIRRCDVRVVAATSQNLRQLIKQGRFREELYYRLNVIELALPPLRDRLSDILPLAQHFLKFYGTKYRKENLRLSREAENLLLAYHFPGNVRELENILQRAVVVAEGKEIRPDHLPPALHERDSTTEGASSFKLARKLTTEKFEREFIENCLKASAGNVNRAAKLAGLHVTNLHAKLKKYQINPHKFKP
jgi:Nif-specific regulatory protein